MVEAGRAAHPRQGRAKKRPGVRQERAKAGEARSWRSYNARMSDLIFLCVVVAFFAVVYAFTVGCDRLIGPPPDRGTPDDASAEDRR